MRTATTHLELDISGTTNMVFSITAAQGSHVTSESLSFVLDGVPQRATELTDRHGTRLHQFVSGPGTMIVDLWQKDGDTWRLATRYAAAARGGLSHLPGTPSPVIKKKY